MWDIVAIDPTTFNVVSDLTAQVVAGLLVCVLGFVYPYLVWHSVRAGRGVGLDGLLAPPDSLFGAAVQFFKGDTSRLLVLRVSVIILIATIAHPLADVFLEFKPVEVGENAVCNILSGPTKCAQNELFR